MSGRNNTDAFLLERADLQMIKNMIPPAARILDLGCGSGRLLKALQMEKRAKVTGVERDEEKLAQCVQRGVPVIQANLDSDLAEFFADNTYDFVILSLPFSRSEDPTWCCSRCSASVSTGSSRS